VFDGCDFSPSLFFYKTNTNSKFRKYYRIDGLIC